MESMQKSRVQLVLVAFASCKITRRRHKYRAGTSLHSNLNTMSQSVAAGTALPVQLAQKE